MKAGTVELRIERVVSGGYGLARTDDGVVLVRGGLPGERVTARPKASGGVLRAYAIEVIEPHPERVDFDLPPGADLPLTVQAQHQVKRSLVEEALSRIARQDDVEVEPVRPSPRDLGYRAVAQYAVTESGELGARAPGSDRIVPLSADPLVSEPVSAAFDLCASRSLHGIEEVVFRGSVAEGRALVGLIGGKGSVDRLARALVDGGVAGVTWAASDPRGRFRGKTKLLAGAESLLEDFGGVTSSVTVESFSQVNPPAAGTLFADAAREAGGGARALDLYAGSGVLGFHLAGRFDEVVAVEISADAVRRGKRDLRRLGLEHVRFERADARTAGRFFPADVVVVDPPRAGLSSETLALLVAERPRRIVSVSCNPTTWARDAARLVEGGYRLRFVRPYDFYPYTHHVEVLSVLDLEP